MNYLKDLEYLKGKLKKANITYRTKPLDNIENCLKALEIIKEELRHSIYFNGLCSNGKYWVYIDGGIRCDEDIYELLKGILL